MNNSDLWMATAKNLGVSIIVYAALLFVLWLMEFVPAFQGQLLHFGDAAWCVGIPASVIGVCYILTIRNPQNYTGFYLAVLMSVLLGVQFFLQKNYDLAFLSICICIPFQVKSIVEWQSGSDKSEEPFAPEFLSWKGVLLSLLAFVLIGVLDYVQILYLSKTDNGVLLNVLSCVMFSGQLIANFWLIYRKNDSWAYWIVYSVAGIAFFAIINNAFSVVLFLFFLVINSMAGWGWIRITPKENYGWLKRG